MTILWRVPPEQLDDTWPLVKDDIEAASGSRFAPSDIKKFLHSGDMQLWVVGKDNIEAVVLTEVHQFPRMKTVRLIMTVGRDRTRWVHHLREIEDWARQQGCAVIEALARPGWEKVLRDYRKTHVMLEKELGNG